MKWLAIGIGFLFVGAVLHRMRRAHYDRWMDVDA
jgi:hypothetical protein